MMESLDRKKRKTEVGSRKSSSMQQPEARARFRLAPRRLGCGVEEGADLVPSLLYGAQIPLIAGTIVFVRL